MAKYFLVKKFNQIFMSVDSYKTEVLEQAKAEIPQDLQKYLPDEAELTSLIIEWYGDNIEVEEAVSMLERGCMVKCNEELNK
ncbi:hypothetical protein [Chitinophaga tropicalis]|uniref:Uncharacterized protein n=1 Tax=Chitinophaga tropicalis TaxID=2683588 RepID=A0A7K1U148_9BACT|nr:hypothetical protein [Chitinophaga tropicalis]MVT07725.1 hypothetical protein [Chitinophaga tropicalis]